MNIDEAIEYLNDLLVGTETFDDSGQPEAVKLGKEALIEQRDREKKGDETNASQEKRGLGSLESRQV